MIMNNSNQINRLVDDHTSEVSTIRLEFESFEERILLSSAGVVGLGEHDPAEIVDVGGIAYFSGNGDLF